MRRHQLTVLVAFAAVWSLSAALLMTPFPAARAAPLDDIDFEANLPSVDSDLTLDPPAGDAPGSDDEPSPGSPMRPQASTDDPVAAARQVFRQKDFAKSLDLLVVAKAQRPSLPPPRLILADMYFQANMRQAGQATLERVAVENPNHPELYRLFGSVALTDRRWTEAVMHFRRALELPPPSSWSDKQRQSFVISTKKGLAAAAQRRGDLQTAARVLGELVELKPDDSKLRDRWASTLFSADLKDKAYEQFKISYLRDRSMAPPEMSMGVMCVNDGDFRQADRWFAKAVKFHPQNAKLHFQIAVALMVQDRATDSARHSSEAARLGLDSPDLHMVRGYAARQLRAYEAAEKFFRKVLAEKPDDAAAMNQLALVLLEQNDRAKKQEALELAERMVELRENSANARATLAWVKYRMGNVAEAQSMFRELMRNPNLGTESLYLAGRAFSDQGNAADAAEVADKLSGRISLPGIYVLRPVARQWLAKQQASAPADVSP